MRSIALDDETRQFALLLRSVIDYAIYMLDADGYIRSWNTGGERIKGYLPEEIIGQHFSCFYTPEDRAAGAPERSLAVAREHGRFEAEACRVRKDGTRFQAHVVIDAIYQDGELVGFAKITRDITERLRTQQALLGAQLALAQSQKMEAIGKLTLGLAHDFNNLLTVIGNSLDMIAQRPGADDRTHRLVDTALRASDRASLLTRQLLAFGRGQSLAPERCEINALIRRSLELYRRAVGDAITLEVRLSEEPLLVEVDTSQFEAAVLNLVANSRDAMRPGGTILIESDRVVARDPSTADAPDRAYVRVTIRDDGCGIPPEIQERVFEPFFTTKEVGKGSGLGLSQVFGFAGQSDGFAQLESAPSQGTAVHLYLPALEQ